MTIIAYKNGVMAADSVVTASGVQDGFVAKMVRNKDGDLLGCSGDAAWCYATIQWFAKGERGKRPHMAKLNATESPGYAILVRAAEKTKVWEICCSTDVPSYPAIIDPRSGCALGSGAEVARGAMFSGADAISAAVAACHLVNGCGGDVHAMGHRGPLRTLVAAKGWQ